jgi:hypothetical protein
MDCGRQSLSRTAGEGGRRDSGGRVRVFPVANTLTRLATLGTLSRGAGEGQGDARRLTRLRRRLILLR